MKRRFLAGRLLLPLVLVAVLLWFFTALNGLNRGRTEEGRQQLEDSLHRAATAYYAAEGIYPPTLDTLAAYGGIQIDESRYAVFYEVFAGNLMPDITVLVNER